MYKVNWVVSILGTILLYLLLANIEVHAQTVTQDLHFRFVVQIQCNVDGIIVPVNTRDECNKYLREGIPHIQYINPDGTTTIVY